MHFMHSIPIRTRCYKKTLDTHRNGSKLLCIKASYDYYFFTLHGRVAVPTCRDSRAEFSPHPQTPARAASPARSRFGGQAGKLGPPRECWEFIDLMAKGYLQLNGIWTRFQQSQV